MESDGFDKKLGSAIIKFLIASPLLADMNPKHWNDQNRKKTPRIGIKVQRGEEMVYRAGVYQSRVEIKVTTKAVKTDHDADNISAIIERMLYGDPCAHEKVTSDLIHVFALERAGVAKSTENDLRNVTVRLNAVAFEK